MKQWFPEVHDMIGIVQPEKYHGKNDVYDHTMETLDNARTFADSPDVLLGALFHDVGKTLTPKNVLPRHIDHDKNGLKLIDNIAKRLKMSNTQKKAVSDAIEFHMATANIPEMRPGKVLDMVRKLKRNQTLDQVLSVSQADRMRDSGLPSETFEKVRIAELTLGENVPPELSAKFKGRDGQQISQMVNQWRIERYKKNLD